MAFLKNRVPLILIGLVFILAAIGTAGMVISDPAGFLQRIAVIALIGMAIYLLFRRFYKASPQKKEQRAFLKAAKRSKKRLQQKSGEHHANPTSILSAGKKKTKKKTTPSHLTVIEGKKAKKKNRASF
ncbi:SA1362 family protein [Neobacillus terrae]|uniref:SA1362 family protein n=1 Tax=Neobacillus terrae TaxID=3034837 RepID=UPI003082E99E